MPSPYRPVMTPLRKSLISLGDIVDNTKTLARKLESTTDAEQRATLIKRIRFHLAELTTGAKETHATLPIVLTQNTLTPPLTQKEKTK